MWLRALLLVAIAAATAACGERAEPMGTSVPAYPVTVRGAGAAPVSLDRRAERIVALDAGAAELVAALGAGANLVGLPAGTQLPEADGARAVTGTSGLVDVDAVVAARPDLVLAGPDASPTELEAVSRRAGTAVYVQPATSVADVVRATLELGALVGEPVRARRLVRSIRASVDRAQAEARDAALVRVFVDTGFLSTVGEGSLLAELVRRAGGELVATAEANPPADACDVVRLRPEVVLRVVDPDAALQPPAPRLGACGGRKRAIRVETVSADVVDRAGPRVGEALELVVRALHDADG